MHDAAQRNTLHGGWRAVRAVLFATILAFACAYLWTEWDRVRAAAAQLTPGWWWIVASCAPVLAGYAILIEVWRQLLAAWGTRLPPVEAARIWTVSNLGKYVPGKVWTIGAMAVMARQSGASSISAMGAALLVQVATLSSGFGVVAL
ncbi:MAG: hypothetical protein ABR499_07585, partial [Gemmatimonadaceae bacterium]